MGMYGFWSVLFKMHDTARHNIEIFAVLRCCAVLIGRFLPIFYQWQPVSPIFKGHAVQA